MKSCRSDRRKGGLVLEYALILPLFLILILATMEFAALFFVRHAMLNAARDAARSYAIHEFDSSGSIDLASQRLPNGVMNFTITATPDSDSGLDCWVQISTPMSQASLGDPLGLLGVGDLTVRVTMRKED